MLKDNSRTTFSTDTYNTHKPTPTQLRINESKSEEQEHCWNPFLFPFTPFYFRVFVHQRICNTKQNKNFLQIPNSLSLTYKQKKNAFKETVTTLQTKQKKTLKKSDTIKQKKKNEVNHLVEKIKKNPSYREE